MKHPKTKPWFSGKLRSHIWDHFRGVLYERGIQFFIGVRHLIGAEIRSGEGVDGELLGGLLQRTHLHQEDPGVFGFDADCWEWHSAEIDSYN